MLLCLSTVPHLFAIMSLWKYRRHTQSYIFVIYGSTKLSILYHVYRESHYVINILDHLMAGIWFLYDMYMAYRYTKYKAWVMILCSEILTLILNLCIGQGSQYKILHSLWHLLHAFKAYYIACLISHGIKHTARTHMLRITHVYNAYKKIYM